MKAAHLDRRLHSAAGSEYETRSDAEKKQRRDEHHRSERRENEKKNREEGSMRANNHLWTVSVA